MDYKKTELLNEDFSFRRNDKLYDHLKNLSSKKITQLHNTIFNDNKQNIDQNLKNSVINSENALNINTKDNSLRISSLEIRLDKSERLLKFFEEILKMKETDRDNEMKIDRNKIIDLNRRIIILEDNIKIFQKKLQGVHEIFNEKFADIDNKYNNLLNNKNSITEFYSNKLNDVENVLKKNEAIINNVVENKLNSLKANLDSNGFDDLLNIINEVSKNSDQNDMKILESKEIVRNIQNDHIDFLKIVTILKEKSDTLDYLMDQLGDLKKKYLKIMKIFNEETEENNQENKFLNKIYKTDHN